MVTVQSGYSGNLFVTWNIFLRLDSDGRMQSPSIVPPLSVVTAAVQANLVLVAQGIDGIGRLGGRHYTTPVAGCFNSTVGGHVRHVIEHYQAVLTARESGELNYEKRARDLRIETEGGHAIEALGRIERDLVSLSASGAADVMLRLAAETTEGGLLVTSLARELEFLVSHTVHHYALVAVLAHAHGVIMPTDFGMAPSTLKYRQTLSAACAR